METDIPTLSPLVTSPDFTISNIGMDQSGMDKACAFLRDKIYSDKILATIRETLTNAIDEHVKHNVDRPVETGLRLNDQGKYEFYVRDFAKGLSDENLRNIFGMYFRSTKSHSNDMIGGFGLGAKAPSCYNDIFYVNSYHEGVKTCYMFTMGANDRGSSVVQILDLAREDTNESGLEVFIEVKYSDLLSFDAKIRSLVYFCNTPVEYIDRNGDKMVPLEPEHVVSKNGFEFKFYTTPSSSFRETYLQMGNVNYEKCSNHTLLGLYNNETLPKNPVVVVNIPIGKMSLPISRESFEETSSNSRVKEDIIHAFNQTIEDDLKQFAGKTLNDIIIDKNEPYFEGTIFKQHKSVLYPDLFEFISRLGRCNAATIAEDAVEIFKGKKLLALIPVKKTSDMWIGRLIDKAISQNKSYYYINESTWSRHGVNNSEINEVFVAKKVNSRFFGLGYSTNSDDKDDIDEETQKYHTPYSAKEPNRYRSSSYINNRAYSAFELHNTARKNLGLDPAADVSEAKQQCVEMRQQGIKLFNTTDKMAQFCIIKDSGHQSYGWSTASKKLYEAMKSLGWLDMSNSVDVNFRSDILSEIAKNAKKEAEHRQYVQAALPTFIKSDYIFKVQNRLHKKPRYAPKMAQILTNIKCEDSVRSRVLKHMTKASTYYDSDRLTRSDLRKILTLK